MPQETPFEIVTIPALSDNYDFLIHEPASGATACVDVADPAPVLAALEARGWSLTEIWLTHHHWDHIDGAEALSKATGAPIIGGAADAHRLPPLTRTLTPGEAFDFAGHAVEVIDVPGHTIGHVAFHIPAAKALFSADSLMALGCGRLFEGTPAQMWDSLRALAALPEDTIVYSGHEYTEGNARFALTIEPGNTALKARAAAITAARAKGEATVPSPLALEKATNPFLRAHLAPVKTAIGMDGASDLEVFTEIRARKDRF